MTDGQSLFLRLGRARLFRTVHVPVAELNGALFPIVLSENGLPVLPLAIYARSLVEEGWSSSKVHLHLEAICRLRSYSLSIPGRAAVKAGHLLRSYVAARVRGPDPKVGVSPLGWRPISTKTAAAELARLTNFSDFCETYLGRGSLNPKLCAAWMHPPAPQFLSTFSGIDGSRADLLYHLRDRRRTRARRVVRLAKGTSNQRRARPKHFPVESIVDLVDQGCVSPRDRMIVLLMAFGGLRISEPLHIYTRDVETAFPTTGAARVLLDHPIEGELDWISSIHPSQRRHGSRATFLQEEFGRLPRCQLGKGHPEHAGWKGMTFAASSPDDRWLHWIEEEHAGAYFRKLLHEYVDENRGAFITGRLKHPYLFFKERRRQDYGEPLTLDAVHKMFTKACSRIGLRGCESHSCRHFYGHYLAEVVDVKPEIAKDMLHHGLLSSTDVYFRMSPHVAREILAEKLGEKLEKKLPDRVQFPPHWKWLQ